MSIHQSELTPEGGWIQGLDPASWIPGSGSMRSDPVTAQRGPRTFSLVSRCQTEFGGASGAPNKGVFLLAEFEFHP